jgi:outer membrane receptor protein involved in Fe transport
LLLCWAAAAAGQGSGDDAPQPPEEIVVTGERQKRSLKDTPSSVAVFEKKDVDELASPDRVMQLLQFIPNVQIGSSRETPSIRGQDSLGVLQGLPGFLGGARPRTTLQVDGRAVGYNELLFGAFGLWDVDRVEVFRSPQTTTQGPNAIAGAIFIQTADPTYAFESRLRAIGGQAHTRELSGAVSAPLIDDQLAFRVAGDLRFSHTSSDMSGPVEGVNLNHDRYGVLRAKLLAEPRALPGLRALLTYTHSRSGAPQVELTRRPLRERRFPNYLFGFFKIDEDSVAAAISYPIDAELQSRTTVTWGDGRIRRFAPVGFGETQIHARDRSFESILEWKPGGPLTMVGGIHLLAQNLDQRINLSAANLGVGGFKDRQRGRGLFGEATWRPTDRFSLTAGLRYQSDRKDRFGALLGGTADLPIDFDQTWHALLPKVSAAYDLTPNVRVGAMVLRAYNPGGVSLDLLTRTPLEFRPELLWDYEAFTRARLLGGALTVTGNLFYNDIRNAQRQLDIDLQTPGGIVGLSAISNAPSAHTYGAELELGYRVSDRLALRAAAGLLRTRLTKTLSPDDPILDKNFARSPRFTGAAGIDWEPFKNFRLTSQVRHNSAYFGDDANTPLLRVAGSTTVDAKATWRTPRFTAFAYAQNLLDEFHVTAWTGPVQDPHVGGTANDPREIGLGIETRF